MPIMAKPYLQEFRKTSWPWPQGPSAVEADREGLRDVRRLPVELDEGRRRGPCAPGITVKEASELRDARKRTRLLEQENEVLRRAAAYLSQANLPGK
jgi:hypothetical protein